MNPVGPGALTPRQQEIMRAMVAGSGTNKDIAARVFMGVSTVKTHIERMFAITGSHSRIELAVWWVRCTETSQPADIVPPEQGRRLRTPSDPG